MYWSIFMTQYQSIVEQIETYKRLTRTSKVAVLTSVVLGVGLGIGAGFLGVLVFWWLEFYLHVINPVAIGLLSALGVVLGSRWGAIGRGWVRLVIGILAGLVGYLAMLFFISRFIDPVDPLGLMWWMLTVNERTFFGLALPLWILWSFEGAIAGGLAGFLSWSLNHDPICGQCGVRCSKRVLFTTSPGQSQDVIRALADKDYGRLKELPFRVVSPRSP